MWLIKVFCVISFTVLCATQNPDEDVVSTTPTILPAPTELPMWSVTPTLSVDPPAAQIYAGESVSLSCSTTDSPPDWTYLFFHNDQDKPLQSSNPSYTSYNINSSKLTDRGTYWCQVKRRQEPSAFSNSISLVVNDPPTPSLQLESGWLDVFPTENVEFRCSIPGGSEWTFSWYREGQEVLEKDSNMVFAAERSVLTVTAASQLYAGNYVCKGRHKSKAITTGNSNPLLLSVYAHKPKPSVIQTPKFDKMYTGESVSLSCRVSMSTGWQYVWYQNNKELQTTDKYTLNSPNQSNSGQYMCQAKRGKTPFYSDESETVTLHFSDPPKPSLKLVTRWLDVFESEEMEMSCEMNGSDWTFTWYKNGKILHEDFNTLFEGSSLFIMSATQAVQGIYSCKAHHSTRKVSSELSNTANITVYENIPKPMLSRDPGFKQMYVGEKVTLTCKVDVSSGWEYQWYKDGIEFNNFDTSNSSYTISFSDLSDGGKYSCKAFRYNETVLTDHSDNLALDIIEIPVPSLKLINPWLDVFPFETVKLSCGVQNSSDWTYTWYRDEEELQDDNSLSFDSDGATLSIKAASASHRGQYRCSGRHKSRTVSTNTTSGILLKVYNKKPSATFKQNPEYKVMYPGESLFFSCHVNVSSGWEYLWYKDGKQLTVSGNNHTISSAVTANSGSYKCRAKRGNDDTMFLTSLTQALSLQIEAKKPKPLITQDPNAEKVYIGESVSFGCRVEASAGWEYLWYKDGAELPDRGSSFKIQAVTSSDSGTYHCMARRGKPNYYTEHSEKRNLHVSEIPVPSLRPVTPWSDVFPSESVKLSCGIQGSSDWTYTWYRGKQKLQADKSLFFDLDRATLSITSASASHRGQYRCSGRHKSRTVSTNFSSELELKVYDKKPSAELKQNPDYKVMYVGESLFFSCHVNVSSGWEYLWYKDEEQLTATENNHTISSVVTAKSGSYKCRAKRGQNVFHADFSETLKLDIEVRPWAAMTLLTGWSEVFSTDSLVLRCEVQGNQDLWNYTWFKEEETILLQSSGKYTVTPQNDPEQRQYTCQGIRTERPLYSIKSKPFKTKNLLLKRRVLLSISGCLFFGLIAVFIGCIVLRITRKPAEDKEKPEEPNLFLSLAELKAREDASCPLVEYITDAALTALSKDGDDNGTICSELTALPITSQEEQATMPESLDAAENNGGLISFK